MVVQVAARLLRGFGCAAGKTPVRKLLPIWLEERKLAVTPKTYVADSALERLLPTSMASLQIGSVADRDVSRALVTLTRQGPIVQQVARGRTADQLVRN